MDFLAEAILHVNDSIPGMAVTNRQGDGRLKKRLRVALVLLGAAFVAAGALLARIAYRAFDDGSLSLLVAILVALPLVAILAGGVGCTVRGLRNPSPVIPADNVISLHDVRVRVAVRQARSRF